MFRWIALLLLALPALEIAAFIAVGLAIGFLPAIGLSLLTTFAGVLVLRQAGRAGVTRMRTTMAQGGVEGFAAGGLDALRVMGGFLLVLPGFITDAIGVALLVPPLRRWLGGLLVGAVGAAVTRRAKAPRRGAGRDGVLDLDPAEWRPEPEPILPPRPTEAVARPAPAPSPAPKPPEPR